MRTEDFDYELPLELIAQRPLPQRSASRLMVLDGSAEEPWDAQFSALPGLLRPGDLLVLNDTRVVPARLYGRKQSGGSVEILLERLCGQEALVQIRASKSPPIDSSIVVGDQTRLRVLGRRGPFYRIRAEHEMLEAVFARWGRAPLPPYIEREPDPEDDARYQTVYARAPGAVAAPTAGLHFDEALLRRLDELGVNQVRLTLHVGAGTFQPVRAETPEGYQLHAERARVGTEVVAAVATTRSQGGRVVAVGTTVVRALESAAQSGQLAPFAGDTNLFLYPGCRFRVVDRLVTNLHLPRSSLLMLVCAFAGYGRVMAGYRQAVDRRYRFFSYGDAMFLTPGDPKDLPPRSDS